MLRVHTSQFIYMSAISIPNRRQFIYQSEFNWIYTWSNRMSNRCVSLILYSQFVAFPKPKWKRSTQNGWFKAIKLFDDSDTYLKWHNLEGNKLGSFWLFLRALIRQMWQFKRTWTSSWTTHVLISINFARLFNYD